ncbi:hypothetical protein CR513_04622, partial [Mucuna pruriens]
MNNVSPLEAQAFNYLSFGFLTLLNNFWTWLAVSFWRTQTPKPELPPPPDDPIPDPVAVAGPVPAPVPSPTVVLNGPNGALDGVNKGKFTLYYEGERECQSEETITEEWEDWDGRGEWWESWERLLRMKQGENEKGWYTCQDLTVLNGSVVRLWDGAFTAKSRTRDTSTCVLRPHASQLHCQVNGAKC